VIVRVKGTFGVGKTTSAPVVEMLRADRAST